MILLLMKVLQLFVRFLYCDGSWIDSQYFPLFQNWHGLLKFCSLMFFTTTHFHLFKAASSRIFD